MQHIFFLLHPEMWNLMLKHHFSFSWLIITGWKYQGSSTRDLRTGIGTFEICQIKKKIDSQVLSYNLNNCSIKLCHNVWKCTKRSCFLFLKWQREKSDRRHNRKHNPLYTNERSHHTIQCAKFVNSFSFFFHPTSFQHRKSHLTKIWVPLC